jgi:hypothetical protein
VRATDDPRDYRRHQAVPMVRVTVGTCVSRPRNATEAQTAIERASACR